MTAHAKIYQYEIGGKVISRVLTGEITDADTGLAVGTLVSLKFLVIDIPFSTYFDTYSDFALYDTFDLAGQFGNFSFINDPPSPTIGQLFVSNATPIGFYDRIAMSRGDLDGNVVANLEPRIVDFELDDDTQTVFDDFSVPTSLLASDFNNQFNFFFASNADRTVSARVFFTVTSIEIVRVPEPSECIFSLSMMAMSAVRRRPCPIESRR